jgi:hypothetical protein
MPAIDDVAREVAALSKQRAATLQTAAAPVAGGRKNLSMSLPIGARVLDLVTGVEGTVIDGKRENVVIPPAGNAGG